YLSTASKDIETRTASNFRGRTCLLQESSQNANNLLPTPERFSMRAKIGISMFTALRLLSRAGMAASAANSSLPSRSVAKVIEITNESLQSRSSVPSRSSSQKTTPAKTTPKTAKTLSWNVPAKRTDGSSFNSRELGGYYLNVKNLSTGKTSQIEISNPDTTSFSLKSMGAGQYVVSIQSYDIDGLTSPESNKVQFTI